MAKAGTVKTGVATAARAAKPRTAAVKATTKTPAPAAKADKTNMAVKAIAAKAPKKSVKTIEKPVAKPADDAKDKLKKPKLVRDSFTMPEAEYAVLGEVKKACLKAGIEVKKSELLRVGVALIRQLDTAKLKEILASLPALKAGRPKKSK